MIKTLIREHTLVSLSPYIPRYSPPHKTHPISFSFLRVTYIQKLQKVFQSILWHHPRCTTIASIHSISYDFSHMQTKRGLSFLVLSKKGTLPTSTFKVNASCSSPHPAHHHLLPLSFSFPPFKHLLSFLSGLPSPKDPICSP